MAMVAQTWWQAPPGDKKHETATDKPTVYTGKRLTWSATLPGRDFLLSSWVKPASSQASADVEVKGRDCRLTLLTAIAQLYRWGSAGGGRSTAHPNSRHTRQLIAGLRLTCRWVSWVRML